MEGDFNLTRGDSISLRIDFNDGGTPPIAVDISGRTLKFTIKRDYNDADSLALVQASVTFPSNAESQSGTGWFFVPCTETNKLEIDDEVWCDFQQSYIDSRGNQIVETLAVFKKKVGPDVTKSI